MYVDQWAALTPAEKCPACSRPDRWSTLAPALSHVPSVTTLRARGDQAEGQS